jgi:hypothetical protein
MYIAFYFSLLGGAKFFAYNGGCGSDCIITIIIISLIKYNFSGQRKGESATVLLLVLEHRSFDALKGRKWNDSN